MSDLVVTFLLSNVFACRQMRSVYHAHLFADDVPDLPTGTQMACFVKLCIVRLVTKGRCS